MPTDKEQIALDRLSDMHYSVRNNLLINNAVKDTVHKILNSIENDEIKLKVDNINVEEKMDNDNIAHQKEVRNKGQIWSNNLRADLELIDKSNGKVIDKVNNMKIATIPKITDRGTFLIHGNEYQFTKQSRLKPGVYTKVQNNGEISSFFNVDKTIDFERGFNNNFKINFDPERKLFNLTYGSKNIPLISALKAVGVTKDEIVSRLGSEVAKANEDAYSKNEVRDQVKLYHAVFGKLPPATTSHDQLKKEIKDRLFATGLDPDVTKITLGKPYKNVNKDVLLDATKKIININKGEIDEDDREALIFKSFHDVEDHVKERLIKKSEKIINNIRYKLGKTKQIERSLSHQTIDPFIVGTITTSQLSNPPTQTNVMSIIGEGNKVTVMGEGGIGTANAVTNDTRNISNSEAGFIDPLHTPEGSNIGVAVHTSLGTVKIGNDLYGKFITPSGKKTMLRPMDVYNKNIAFPDQYDTNKGKLSAIDKKVKVINQGKIKEVSPNDVDFIIHEPSNMFDSSANLIPFLDSIQGNRGLTASKMQEQAVPLKYREKPLFKILNKAGINLHEAVASQIALPKSKIDGEVVSVSDDEIIVKDKKGDKHKHQLYNHFSLNSESYLHNEPKVKVGDKVKSGDILADNNFTQDGQLALGTNLKVAYVPYKGYNYEDSAIMSESAAKKLTSLHMYDLKTKRSSKGIFSKEKFRAYYPEELKSENASKLDKDGVIKVGEKVNRDDVVIAQLEKRTPTADDLALGRLDKQLKRDMSNNAIKWDNDHIGTVMGVQKHGNSVVVNIKTEEPLKVADKISGLHGNKHIISKIVPDEEMPIISRTGEHVDLTMNPIGVSNRINTSQLLEAAVGKIAKHTGKQYEIKNFSPHDNTEKILNDLKAAGLTDKEELIDPETNKPMLNPVMVGDSHILKLEHKVDHKFSARYREGYDANEQPVSGGHTGGKNIARMETAALLARGANENIREMMQIKGQKNDEYWKAMETGQSLPPPKKAFVWDKMLAMMHGSGINVTQKGKTFSLKPLTDTDVEKISSGKLERPYETYRKKDLAPMKEGLFDPVKAGGIHGDNYTHFDLPEKILNPITTDAASNLLDMPTSHLESIIEGKKFISKDTGKIVNPGTPNSISGGPAVEHLLSKINVDEDLKQAKKFILETKNPTQINKYNKKIKYLKALKDSNMKPTDYMISKVLVTPSKFRPMFAMGTEGTVIMSDVNELYQQTAHSANALKELKGELDKNIKDEDVKNLHLAESRGALYNDVKAVSGLREPTSFLHRTKNKKGYIMQISGGPQKQSKEGFFQDKVMERRQDLVGRSTIILNPDLGGDQIGIPKDMATKIFQPKIMRKLVSWGHTPLEAQKQIKDKTESFNRARQVVADDELVIANRAPTLHRWNMTAFKPVLTEGKSIEVPAVAISRNFTGDFDGDCCLSSIFISIKNDKISKKISFGGDFNIDSSNKMKYIKSFLKLRRINIPTLNRLGIKNNSDIYHIHISEFPRIENSKIIKENGNEEYDVPNGILIFTIDNVTHKFIETKVNKFSIHKNLINYNIELSTGDNLWLSSDQSAIALNRKTFELERVAPTELNGKVIPKVKHMNVKSSINKISLINFSLTNKAIDCKEEMILNEKNGWLIGVLVGDGWISIKGRNDICLSNISKNISEEFDNIINNLMTNSIPKYSINNNHKFNKFDCSSSKHTKSSSALAKNFIPLIGEGAYNKHLPPFYLSAPEEFRLGLLSGLLDTDGVVGWLAKKNNKRQFNIQYSTMSDRLAEEIITLCRSLGITASITFGNKRPDGIEKRVVISTTTIYRKNIKLRHEQKFQSFFEFCNEEQKISSVSSRLDLVPFSDELFIISKEFIHHKRDKDVYVNINGSKYQNWMMSRVSAKKLINKDKDHKLPQRWIDIVNNESVTWVYANDIKLNPKRMDMYDITAPGPYTFMLNNGIIVQDTFQIHVPISSKAHVEAEKMLPSSDMIRTGYDEIMNAPQGDITTGAWLVSKGKGGKDTGLKFETIEDARKAFKTHKFNHADKITIDGKKAAFGIHEINSVVPDEHKNYDIELNQKNIDNWIKDVTKSTNGKIGLGLADKIKEVGNSYVTTYGFTLGLEDTKTDKKLKNQLIEEADKKIDWKNPSSIIKHFKEATKKGHEALSEKYNEDSMLGIGIKSGSSKGIANTAAITLMPGIITDAEDKEIAIPITKSYSEGLDTSSYWTAAKGARGGSIKKSISTSKPGWLTKDLINSIYETKIYNEEPMDTEGIEYDITDKKGILNRYLAQDVKDSKGKIVAKRNDLVTSDLINKMNKNKIQKLHVQSPITDPTPGDGFSNWSYGVDYNGKKMNRGDNIGIISSHTMTQPATQMVLKAFHTGGAAQTKSTGSLFDRFERALRFTRIIPDKATLSSMDAKVKQINKSPVGGYDITLKDDEGNEEARYIHPNNDVIVKSGQKVKKGEQISTGRPSMHDILKYKGMRETQKYLVNELDDIMDKKLDKRDIETVVRGMTNTTKILNPGSSDYVVGDIAPYTTVENYNKNNLKEEDVENIIGDHFAEDILSFKKNQKIIPNTINILQDKGIKRVKVFKDRIKHEPFLTPSGIGARAAATTDWIARLAHNRLADTLSEGTTQGWKTEISELSHPIPKHITGQY